MFAKFVARHRAFQEISQVEYNSEMLESYIMIDPLGQFYQNGQDTLVNGYQYSRPVLEVGARRSSVECGFQPAVMWHATAR